MASITASSTSNATCTARSACSLPCQRGGFCTGGAFFGAARSLLVMSVIALGVLAVLCGFVALGVHVNIFAIFGLILASAVGIDYLIFALNEDLSQQERVFGIFAAFITSFISFFALSFSQTPAVSVFGLAVSLCVAFYGLAACTLAMKNLD